jgi:signal transduction histidine kinase
VQSICVVYIPVTPGGSLRLAVRHSAAIVFTSLVVFGAYGGWLLFDEAADLDSSTERELRFVGTSLRVGLENALRDRQLSDVEETTLRLEGVDTPIDVFVFERTGSVVAAPGGLPEGPLRSELSRLVDAAKADVETRVTRSDELPARSLLLATPLLSDDGEVLGVLAVVRPLDDANADLLETTGGVVLTIGTFVVLAAAVGSVVGDRWLARPLNKLVGAMRRARAGDWSERVPVPPDDEVARVTVEFNAMLGDLAEARARGDREAEGRRAALHSLQAADRLVTVGQLSAAVAHEIGSPLQVLHGRARSLVDRPHDVESTARVGRILVEESERIGRIVSQLLSLTRQRPPTRVEVDLVEASRQVCNLLELEGKRLGVALAAPTGAPLVVTADPDQVRQVVLNLVTNALAATPRGGRVAVTVEPGDSRVRLQVVDDGVGMSDEVRTRAFEPLFTTRSDRGGAGLGLYVVRSIVREHGGDVEIESSESRGTSVRVFWPRDGAA